MGEAFNFSANAGKSILADFCYFVFLNIVVRGFKPAGVKPHCCVVKYLPALSTTETGGLRATSL